LNTTRATAALRPQPDRHARPRRLSYEVSRSLQACEGAILVIDAAQGIEAQTLANVHLAIAQNLVIVPVLNKIDLPSAQPHVVIEELENVLAIPREEVLMVSAKDGTGVGDVLEAIVKRIPPPKADVDAPLQGLIFDSHYDQYKGVVAYVRLCRGTLEGQQVRLMGSGAQSEILELGVFRPQLVPVKELIAGEVGYVATGFKNVRDAQVGDTITAVEQPRAETASRLQDRPRRWCSPASIPSAARTIRSTRRPREAAPQRRLDQLHAREHRSPWALGFAAASSACCTWRSCRSVSSASSTST
jgi:elongation factor 4